MCPLSSFYSLDFLSFAVKVFLIIWIIYVPIVITARLEKIIEILGEKAQK
jgi:hypothetical protein